MVTEKSRRPMYLLFASIASMVVLPGFLKALLLVLTSRALPGWQTLLCTCAGLVLGGIFFYLAFSPGFRPGKAVRDILTGGLFLLLIRTFFSLVQSLVAAGEDLSWGQTPVKLAVSIVLLVLEALFLAWALFICLLIIRDGENRIPAGKRFLLPLKGMKEILAGACAYGILSFGCGFLADQFLTGLGKSRTVAAFLAKLLVLSLILFAGFCPVLLLMRKKADALISPEETKAGTGVEAPAPEAAGEMPASETPPPAKKNTRGEWICIGAFFLAVVLLSLLPRLLTASRDRLLAGSFSGGIEEAAAYAEKRDYLMASLVADQAEAVPRAWKAWLEGDTEAARQAAELAPGNSMVELLYYYTCAEAAAGSGQSPVPAGMPDLTEALQAHEGDEVWYFAYLDLLSERGELTAAEEGERRRVALELASGNRFRCGAIYPGSLTEKERERLAESLADLGNLSDLYGDRIGAWKALALYAERNGVDHDVAKMIRDLAREYPASQEVRELVYLVIRECTLDDVTSFYRGNSWDTVSEVLQTAEDHPDSFAANELAVQAGLLFWQNYPDDAVKKSVCDRVYPVILNFDRLFEKNLEKDEDLSEEEKPQVRLTHVLDLAETMLEMDLFPEAQEYLEKSGLADSDEDLRQLLGVAAVKNGDMDTALPILEEEYQADPSDAVLTLGLAIAYYRAGDVTASLEKAVAFTDLLTAPGALEESPELGTDFTALVATYITGDKSFADSSYGKTCPYQDFTDQQMRIVEGSQLLASMLDCEYRYQYELGTYLQEDGDAYRKLEEEAFAFTEDYPQLSTGYYLAARLVGNFYNGFWYDEEAQEELIDPGRAVDLYRACLNLDEAQPSVWYSLALTLDHEERYQEALEACQKAIDWLNRDGWYVTDVGADYYGWGILWHSEQLRTTLESKLAKIQ